MKTIYCQSIGEDSRKYFLYHIGDGQYIACDDGGVAFTHNHDFIDTLVDADSEITDEDEEFNRKIQEIASKPGRIIATGINSEAAEFAIKWGWISAQEIDDDFDFIDECAQAGDFADDDWIEGKAMEAAGLPQLED